MRKWTDYTTRSRRSRTKKRIEAWIAEGRSDAGIARELDLTLWSMRALRTALGIVVPKGWRLGRPRLFSSVRVARISVQLRAEDSIRLRELCDRLELTPSRVVHRALEVLEAQGR